MRRHAIGRRSVCWSVAGLMMLLASSFQAAVIERVLVKSTSGAPVEESFILANMKSVPGMIFQAAVLSEDIRRLVQTGNFQDVRSEVDESAPDKVTITVVVAPKRMVRLVIIEGNRQVRTKRLSALVTHAEGLALDEVKAAEDANAIRKRYHDSGYYGVEVDVVAQEIPGTQEVNLVFRVAEEERLKIKAVHLLGVNAFKERELLKSIRTRRPWWRYIFRWGNYFSTDLLEADKDALRQLYYAKGYFDVQIVKVDTVLNPKGTWVEITLHIDEGQPYTVTAVTLAGNARFANDELMPLIQLPTNAVYDGDVETEDLKRLRAQYEALGYIDLRCYPVHAKNSDAHTVTVEYRIVEGVPASIRDITVSGNEVTKDAVIRRELAILPGDLADAGKIRTTKSRLSNLNYFEAVEITPIATEKADEKDLGVKVKEKRTGQLMLGAGFSSEDSALAYVEITQANFDWRNWPSFRGGGQRARLRAQLGTERTDFVASFTEPWWLQRRLRLDLDAFNNYRTEDEYDQKTLGIGMRVAWRWRTYWRPSVGFRLQRVELSDFDSSASAQLRAEDGSYNATRLIAGLDRDSRNSFINPSRGSRLSLTTELLTEALGSYSNAYRLSLSGAKFFPLWGEAVLKVDGEVAIADDISGDPVAIFDRYFAGGAHSLRGFKRREISPVDVNEDKLGGKSMLLASIELIHPLFERIRGSVFCDSGNVWEDVGDIDPSDLNASVGVGIQIDLPVGPIRLDYGWPVVTKLDHLSKTGRFHFNLGYTF